MKNSARIAVAGCINRDTVKRPGKPVIRGYGGILYNIFGLAKLLGDRTVISPVCNLGNDVSKPVLKLLSSLNNIDPAFIRIVATPNNHCMMKYRDDGERDEVFTGFVPAISYSQLQNVIDHDLALINFISGRDMTLGTLRRFRDAFSGGIYLDFHTLSLGLRRNGKRFPRRPRKWREYIACCDYLQMNGIEFTLLSGLQPERESLVNFFKSCVRPAGSVMVVTLGSNGAAMVWQVNGEIKVRFATPIHASEVNDTTGAGDLFAAGFCAGLVIGKSLITCLKLAVDTGAYGCSIIHPQDVNLSRLI